MKVKQAIVTKVKEVIRPMYAMDVSRSLATEALGWLLRCWRSVEDLEEGSDDGEAGSWHLTAVISSADMLKLSCYSNR